MNQAPFIKMSVAGLSLFFSSLAFTQTINVPSKTEVLQSHSHKEFPVAITANALFLYQSSNFYSEDQSATQVNSSPNGLRVREVELEVTAPVDEYSIIEVQPQPPLNTKPMGQRLKKLGALSLKRSMLNLRISQTLNYS